MQSAEFAEVRAFFPELDTSFGMWAPEREAPWFQEFITPPSGFTEAAYSRSIGALLRNLKGNKPSYAGPALKQLLGKAASGTLAQKKALLLHLQVSSRPFQVIFTFDTGCWPHLPSGQTLRKGCVRRPHDFHAPHLNRCDQLGQHNAIHTSISHTGNALLQKFDISMETWNAHQELKQPWHKPIATY